MAVDILIDENDAINALITVPVASVEIIARVARVGETLRLDGMHIELLSGGPLTRSTVARLLDEVGRHFGVNRVIVQGARRTTGRSAGQIPKAIDHEVHE
jgi:hypothetical protein